MCPVYHPGDVFISSGLKGPLRLWFDFKGKVLTFGTRTRSASDLESIHRPSPFVSQDDTTTNGRVIYVINQHEVEHGCKADNFFFLYLNKYKPDQRDAHLAADPFTLLSPNN